MKHNKGNKSRSRRILKSRYFVILVISSILALSAIWLFWYFSPEIRQAQQYKKDVEILSQKIQEQEKKYAADTYGGETPEGTYQMFLEALKTQDINLASKYFILDKQETYKQFFTDIKNNNKWDEMMEDLLKSDNQEGEMKGSNNYVIRVYNDEHYLIAQAVLRIPSSFIETKEGPLTNIWKIIEF